MKARIEIEIDLGDSFCDWDDTDEAEWAKSAIVEVSQIRLGNDVDDDYPCSFVGGLKFDSEVGSVEDESI